MRGGDRGGGRPRLFAELINATFALTPEVVAALAHLAAVKQVSKSEIVRRLILAAGKRLA